MSEAGQAWPTPKTPWITEAARRLIRLERAHRAAHALGSQGVNGGPEHQAYRDALDRAYRAEGLEVPVQHGLPVYGTREEQDPVHLRIYREAMMILLDESEG